MYGFYITESGANLIAQAIETGTKVNITQCAIGDGGNSEEAQNPKRAYLNNETYRKTLSEEDKYQIAPNNPNTLMLECLIPSSAGNLTISEIGFFDDTETLIAYSAIKEQKLDNAEEGLDYTLDITCFIAFSPEQLDALEINMAQGDSQELLDKINQVEQDLNENLRNYKTTLDGQINSYVGQIDVRFTSIESSLEQHKTESTDTINSFKEEVNQEIQGLEETIGSLAGGSDLTEKLNGIQNDINDIEKEIAKISDPVKLAEQTDFTPIFRNLIKGNYHYLITTDEKAPDDVEVVDISLNKDKSAVAWQKDQTIYMSSQQKGVPMETPENCSSYFSVSVDDADAVNKSFFLEELDLRFLDTSNTIKMNSMFMYLNTAKVIDLSSFDVSKVKNFSSMFLARQEGALTTIYANDWSENPEAVNTKQMFGSQPNLGSDYSGAKATWSSKGGYFTPPNALSWKRRYGFKHSELVEQLENLQNEIDDINTFLLRVHPPKPSCKYPAEKVYVTDRLGGSLENISGYSNCTKLELTNTIPTVSDLKDVSDNYDKSVVAWKEGTTIYVSGYGKRIMAPKDCTYFLSSTTFTTMDLSLLDTSEVTNMSGMFRLNDNLTTINVSHFDTKCVRDMSQMFYGCPNLQQLDLSSFSFIGINSSSAMSQMFYNCSNLSKIVASTSWYYYCQTDSYNVFKGCTKLPNSSSSSSGDWEKAKLTTQGGCLTYGESGYLDTLDKLINLIPDVAYLKK